MITHTHIRGIVAGAVSLTKRIAVQAEEEINLSPTIAGNATNALHALTLDVSQLKSLFIIADGALTLKTNSGSAPDNTITLVADEPFLWRTGDATLRDTAGTALTEDITGLYVTNPGADPVALQIFALVDPTV